ncbi:hypothetical protein DPEC_G00248510 [Dallia pectoralis]|uniref:Uncharacterized protein n=1 Tax=Dallia pectoralis TaxID=75939 RepID=A0ACC2FWR9_DALPE|nr:hypothetical protein DPEC_G00248510 [Dallia pectoralis]
MSEIQSEAEEPGAKRRRKMQRRRIQEDTSSEEEAEGTIQQRPDMLPEAPLISQPTYATLEPRQCQFTIPTRPWAQQSPSPQEDILRSPQLHYGEMGYPSNATDRPTIPVSSFSRGHSWPPPTVPASLLDLCSSSHLHHMMTFQEAPRCTTKRWGIHLMQRTDPKSLYRNLLSVMPSMLLLINYLSIVWGSNLKDAAWRVMGHTISNSLVKTINWRGINGKTSLASRRLKDVFIAAVRKTPKCSTATERDIEAAMKKWLQLAPDREGGTTGVFLHLYHDTCIWVYM